LRRVKMLKIELVTTVYPPPGDDEEDYCPDAMEGDVETREVSFGELVALMHQYTQPSCSPAGGHVYEWLSAESEQDYRTGEWTERSIHFSHANPKRYEKYWRYAMLAAKIAK
jgi:hypothetical protein